VLWGVLPVSGLACRPSAQASGDLALGIPAARESRPWKRLWPGRWPSRKGPRAGRRPRAQQRPIRFEVRRHQPLAVNDIVAKAGDGDGIHAVWERDQHVICEGHEDDVVQEAAAV